MAYAIIIAYKYSGVDVGVIYCLFLLSEMIMHLTNIENNCHITILLQTSVVEGVIF